MLLFGANVRKLAWAAVFFGRENLNRSAGEISLKEGAVGTSGCGIAMTSFVETPGSQRDQ